jgi:protein phosphatase methylesterase 1
MSELQKSFAKAKLAKLPPEVPMFHPMDIPEEHHEEDGSSASSVSSTGTLMPSPTRNLFARRSSAYVWIFFFGLSCWIKQNPLDTEHDAHCQVYRRK